MYYQRKKWSCAYLVNYHVSNLILYWKQVDLAYNIRVRRNISRNIVQTAYEYTLY